MRAEITAWSLTLCLVGRVDKSASASNLHHGQSRGGSNSLLAGCCASYQVLRRFVLGKMEDLQAAKETSSGVCATMAVWEHTGGLPWTGALRNLS